MKTQLDACRVLEMFLKRVVLGVAVVCCIVGAIWASHAIVSDSLAADAAAVILHKDNHHHSDSKRD
jgi:hypothetical protein